MHKAWTFKHFEFFYDRFAFSSLSFKNCAFLSKQATLVVWPRMDQKSQPERSFCFVSPSIFVFCRAMSLSGVTPGHTQLHNISSLLSIVLFFRYPQYTRSCFKSILTAGLTPIVVPNEIEGFFIKLFCRSTYSIFNILFHPRFTFKYLEGDEVRTDTKAVEDAIVSNGGG
jgi:hypothetical protein